MIRIEKLIKKYGGTIALDGIDLSVSRGELFAFLGPNGAGKTTTIRILTGLTRLDEGKAALNGHDIEKESRTAKRQCGLVPQHINLDSELTVYENLDIHGRLFDMPKIERKMKIKEMLAYIELENRSHSLVKELSGGMKRRVMVARSLIHSPGILFLDEPTVGLDPNIRRKIWSLVKRIQNDGTTIFLTTHYIEEAEFLADRVAFIDKGKIVKADTPQRLINDLGEWAMDYLQNGKMETLYFRDREAARCASVECENGFTIRRVNLEDAFLSLTGKKVES